MKQEKMIGHRPYAGVLAFAALCAGLPGFITASALGNDECTTATVVQAGVPVPFSTLTATLSGNPPTDALCPNTSLFWGGSRDVWFKWVAPASGIARFSTCDVAGYDTSMVVYAGDCGNLTPVACNGDAVDSTGCQDLHAEVKNLEVLGGTTYYIRIGGYDGAAGAATFTLTYSRVGAWGSNANGQLRVPLSAGMLGKIAAGGEHALGLRSDGTVIAWGANQLNQSNVPPTLGSVVDIAAGSAHSLALRSNGTVAAWGRNSSGQCNVPVALTNAVGIAGGANHSLAVRASGAVIAWGSNTFQQSNVPAGLTGVVQVAAGEIHSMARRSNGSVACWGSNANAQSAVPASLTDAVDVAAGGYHNLAIRANGTVVAWGLGDFGQTAVPADLGGVVDVAGGRYHSLALRADGTIAAWGYNANGQINRPTSMGLSSQVSAGAFFSMSLRDACPADPSKVEPGACGCGSPDVDTDGDGALDCNDQCPTDPLKTEPGQCGCGALETDTDSDGTADCNDQCPTDPLKTEPGQCGCGVPDTDTDGDGTADCNDQCPDLAALTAPITYYADADQDGFGDAAAAQAMCLVAAPAGYATNSSDCNDAMVMFADGDQDGFGAGPMIACGGVATSSDCDDAAMAVFPGAIELCANDGVDNDCDGEAALDAEATDSVAYFVDGDQDGFGAGAATASCVAIAGSVTNADDCDDAEVYFLDADLDGFGAATMLACGTVQNSDDCDDSSALVNPDAVENCANLAVDNDCDGDVSAEESTDSLRYRPDLDQDGFGSGPDVWSCVPVDGYVPNGDDCDDAMVMYADLDLDGFGAGAMIACGGVASNSDCNDASNLVFPGATESCANLAVDNDCDGDMSDADASDSVAYFVDSDNDGFGAGVATMSCSAIAGSVTNANDCNDAMVMYADLDLDGFGAGAMIACGGVATASDCDDTSNLVYPGAAEACADLAVDNDCDGDMSDVEAADSVAYFVDGDQDGFGAGASTMSCSAIAGSVTNANDCDDAADAVFPGALENCANLAVDNDCDGGTSDFEAVDSTEYYGDMDGDGFGNGDMIRSCAPVDGFVTNSIDCDDNSVIYGDGDGDGFGAGPMVACNGVASNSDCDDASNAVFPGAAEVCADLAVDNDCDGDMADAEASDSVAYFVDGDQDGFGAGAATMSCSPIAGSVTVATDCDDASNLVFPGAGELCADLAVDNDCDGDKADAEAADAQSYCVDADQDGFGAGAVTLSCSPMQGQVPNALDCDDAAVMFADGDQDTFGAGPMVACNGVASNSDCDDASNLVFPGAAEACADLAVDNDCDGDTADAEAADALSFCVDADQDGFGAGPVTLSCSPMVGQVTNAADCDDASNLVFPGAAEACADLAIDNDCDGDLSDAEAFDSVAYFADGDQDGFGIRPSTMSCSVIAGWVTNASDCNDAMIMHADLDLDGFGAGPMIACGGVASDSDCDDASNLVFPGAAEVCADLAVDNDCDGDVSDAEASDSVAYFVDGDQDGFGAGASTMSCSAIAGSVTNSTDCDDASVIYADNDGDTFGAGPMVACNGVASSSDCDDSSNLVFPGAAEVCADLAVDNDCDGDMSDAEASDSVAYFVDGDQDGFGAGASTMSCSPIAGSVTNSSDCDDASVIYADNDGDTFGAGPMVACNGVASNSDCDDSSNLVFPGAAEVCANLAVDNDCDGDTSDAEASDSVAYFVDGDQDGFGAGASTMSCSAIAGSVTNSSDCNDAAVIYADNDGDTFGAGPTVACNGVASSSDCNDSSNLVFPGAAEVCADLAVDNDCDGDMSDAEASDSIAYFVDGDQDGFGAGASTMSCAAIAGSVTNSSDCDDASVIYADNDGDTFGAGPMVACNGVASNSDCDDSSNVVFPGAAEVCADLAVDNDCDGDTSDAEASDSVAYFVDGDQDGFGAGASTMSCSAIAGSVTNSSDCDDAAVIYADNDGDTFGAGPMVACNGVASISDCDDSSNLVFPGAAEVCADLAVDNDCDGDMSDTEASDSVAYFVDGDQDGFGAGAGTMSCSPIAGSVTNSSDCNDAAVIYADNDGDTFGAGAMVACNGVASNSDCDDSSNVVFPGAAEVCADLAVDNDCDGDTSDAEASDSVAYFVDGDQDGFGAGASTMSCSAIAGSVTNSSDCDDASVIYADNDGDTFGAGPMVACNGVASNSDCNDSSNAVFPGAAELCADLAVDNDCDGDMSDAEATDSVAYFVDGDQDGFGAGTSTMSCSVIAGSVTNSSDCDDAAVIYADNDGDTFGAGPMVACNGVASNSDCDDSSNLVFPGAAEVCADLAVDNDCDGDMSDAEAADSVAYFVDGDQDGFGAGASTMSCSAIAGSVTNSSDCDDAAVIYADNDGDTFGAGPMVACNGVASSSDCNDSSNLVFPGAAEVCADLAVDNDCDGDMSDAEATDSVAYFVDGDQDGFGAGASTMSCSAIAGSVTNSSDCDDASVIYADNDGDTFGAGPMVACNGVASSSDCNDSSNLVFPGAAEVCADLAVDNDCDGDMSDAEASDSVAYFVDGDQDGFGAGASTMSCSAIAGSVTNSSDCDDAAVIYADNDGDTFGAGPMVACNGVASSSDCDDSSNLVFPGAAEVCADLAVDNDCDGDVSDAEASDSVAYFVDGDQDGFGAGASTMSCSAIAGSVTNSSDCDDAAVIYADNDGDTFGAGPMVACNGVASNSDCDDSSNLVFPGAAEVCADLAVDNDCDGDVSDAEASDSVAYFVDGDQDGFGAGASTMSCAAIAGSVTNSSDCDDAAVIYADNDGDTFGAGPMVACNGVASNSDCDDSSNLVFPGAAEVCADLAVDNDCDGDVSDAEASDSVAYFVDGDQDGFGAGASTMSCSTIAGSVTNSSDCNDASVIYADNDGDTFGAGPMVACNGVASNSDCNDSSNAVFPGAAELCADLTVDNDCDGSTDEAEAADRLTFYADADNDGAGDPNVTQLACSAPAGYVGTAGDNCPADGAKTDPGACGCGVADTDTDADGTADCIDQCPTDPAKTEPGTCGCNVADTDGDGDGLADCVDNCPAIANADQADCNQNGTGDVCEIASGSASDCNTNGVPDSCDIAAGSSTDLDGSGSPDECEFVVGGTGFATIQLALDAAPNGAVIKVGPGSHAPFTAINRGLTVQSIAGDAQTFIDGGNSARAVEISGRVGTRLTLRGFTIRNGSAANGGGMLVTNADPVIENCTFSGNIASGSGGAIHAINSAADILLSSFLGNAAANGGAIALEGSSGIEGGMHISSSIFRDNDAAVDGGAIMSASDLFLLECTLELNAAGSLGGGVRQLDSGRLTVFTSRFCRNLPENISGAFSAVGDNVLSQDCNANGICDADEIAEGDVPDCNANGLPDACDIAGGAADCNENGIPDSCDLAAGTSNDVDANGIPDECKPDCNNNDIPDAFEIATGAVADCNGNAIPDSCDIAAGTAADCNANGAIDACELAEGLVRDCNLNGIPDSCDIAGGATDFDQDGRIDRCEMARGDLNLDGLVNAIDIAIILSYWGTGSAGDANGDGNIDAQDIATVLSNWNLPMP